LNLRFVLPGVLLLLLGGCAGVSTQAPAVLTQTPAVLVESTPATVTAPAETPAVESAPRPAVSASQAVVSLVERARVDAGTGQRASAGASLERALRIEPRNPWLWQELAQLRLTQGQYAQAISLAQKSMSFAGQDKHLRALNWRLIGNARVAQGDAAGAEHALKLAADFEK
jgi:predicted Zn-dependent protease